MSQTSCRLRVALRRSTAIALLVPLLAGCGGGGKSSSPPKQLNADQVATAGQAIINGCLKASYGTPVDKSAISSAVDTLLRDFHQNPEAVIPRSTGFKAKNIRQLLESMTGFLQNGCSQSDASRIHDALSQ